VTDLTTEPDFGPVKELDAKNKFNASRYCVFQGRKLRVSRVCMLTRRFMPD